MQDRYVIGYSSIEKKTGIIKTGIYGWGTFNLPIIITPQMKRLDSIKMCVFTNIDECQDYCRLLSRSYRRDDCWNATRQKSRFIRRFYPLKVESSKRFFNLVLPPKEEKTCKINPELQNLYMNKEIKISLCEFQIKKEYLSTT